jgi:hypothetical protein
MSGHLQRPAIPGLLAAITVAACSASGGVTGLPSAAFDRAFATAMAVTAAEHCGEPVDAGAIRSKLLEYELRGGGTADEARKAGLAFDKTRAEYKLKLTAQHEFCATEYQPNPLQLAAYTRGEFP